ncbi:MAG TPA: DUF4214 domain-containing protein [Thermoanaerobaculia bacterium]|nr:DUF4214 domain-containing protein [Thermoanaerobaculia bacterium]
MLPAGSRVEIELLAIDQYGRDFPAEKMRWGFEPDHSCRGLLDFDQQDRESFRAEAGLRPGRCEARLWVPGNLNLEWRLEFEVVRRSREGYGRGQAEEIARRLYRAVLGREADSQGLSGAVGEILDGHVRSQVDSMFRSDEFQEKRSGLPAAVLLDSFYQGLLGRTADSGGVRTYLDDVKRQRYTSVVMAILESEEFEESLGKHELRR